MIKNQLYPYIEEYINAFLYGFTKEQLDVGLMNGQIKLENLNIRPDGINNELDQSNLPFWLKAGLISKMNFGCSLMNFIGEKPIEANIEGLNIIVTPSYKWIIQNLDSFIYEDLKEMKSEYIPYENNSVNIFSKKINVLDNSIFKKEIIEEFFKDKTKISNFLNKTLMECLEYYYSKNYSLILKIKDIHVRFEDDQLINYMGNIALGIKVDAFELNLSSEGTMKKNNFKVTKFDIYWENNANILIPSNILYDSIKNGALNDSYYTNLKKIKFQNYTYKKDTKFILQNLNCLCNFGTKSINQGKIDLFGKKENNYKIYLQFASNEININLFPDLNIIRNNFKKFVREFSIISQAQEFKPMKKPYNEKNRNFIELLKYMNSNKNTAFSKKFSYKRRMIVRDWLFYFYWCYKCKSSIYNYNCNPLRTEFIRYLNICVKGNGIEKLAHEEDKKDKNGKNGSENNTPKWSKENPNPDNINLSLMVDIKIKGLNLNLHPFISSNLNDEFICIKINNFDSKINLSKDKFDTDFSVKNIILGPSKLSMGEQVVISNNLMKKRDMNLNKNKYNNKTCRNNNINYGNYLILDDPDSNMGFTGFLKKYNPNYNKQLSFIDKAMENININSKKAKDSLTENNNKAEELKDDEDKDKQSVCNSNYSRIKNINFSKQIIKGYEPTPTLQKMELIKQKNEFNISQMINHYNNNKLHQRYNTSNKLDQNKVRLNSNLTENNEPKKQVNTARIPRTQNNFEIMHTGKVIPLNLFEICSNNNSPCLSFKYHKINNNSSMDVIQILLGTIRINLFSEYMIKCANVLKEFEYSNKRAKIKSVKNDPSSEDDDLDTNKKLYIMKKYFYQKLNKLPEKKKTDQIKSYMAYLKTELEKDKIISHESENYEINYLFNIFSKGVNINIDYDNLECIYYSNKNNKICGKAIMPPPTFNFIFNSSKISFKIFDFEFEIDDLDNTKLLFKTLHTILEDKFKMAQLLIEPCLIQIKKDLEKKESELNSKEIKSNNHNLEKNLQKLLKNNLNLNSNNAFSNSDEKNNLNTKEQNDEKESQIISKEKSGTDILDNTLDNNNTDNIIVYDNNTQDNNDNEIIQKIEIESPEIKEKDLLENTLKEVNYKKMKKGKTSHNSVTNKKGKIKESDKKINKTVEDNNANNNKLNLIMRNDDFTNIKNTSLNTYNNSLEFKENNNKCVANKRSVNKGKTTVNEKNKNKSKTIEIPYDNKNKKKSNDNIIQNKNENVKCENKKDNKLFKNKSNRSLIGRDKSNDNILPTSKVSNKRTKNDSFLSTSNLVNKKNKVTKKQSLKKQIPQVVKEPHNTKK